jgi:transcriptional regulator with XRE-family HTH domain
LPVSPAHLSQRGKAQPKKGVGTMPIITPQEIRRQREALNWSANELARRAGVSNLAVSRAEKVGNKKRSGSHRNTLQKIKAALDRGSRRPYRRSTTPGKKLQQRRLALGLSRKQLGELAEPAVSPNRIEQIEVWGRSAPDETARLLAALEKAEADCPAPEMIRPRRTLLGWSFATLAEKSRVSIITIWKLEKGLTKANLAILEALDAALRAGEAQPPEDVGAKLRARRVGAGMRMDDLRDLADVDKGTISAIETGKSRPKARTLKKLGAALDAVPAIPTPADVSQRRRALRLTEKELAKAARVAPSTLRQAERNGHYSVKTWRKLEKALKRLGAGTPLPSGEEVRRERESFGLSLEELAQRAGISVQALWCFEQGRREPTLLTVRAIEAALREARTGGQSGRRRTTRLRPRASRSAKARWASVRVRQAVEQPTTAVQVPTGAPAPKGNGQNPRPLNQTQHDLLDALLDLKAFNTAMRATTAEVAERTLLNVGTLGRAASQLKKEGLVDSQEGRGGGVWLTESGRGAAEGFRQHR